MVEFLRCPLNSSGFETMLERLELNLACLELRIEVCLSPGLVAWAILACSVLVVRVWRECRLEMEVLAALALRDLALN